MSSDLRERIDDLLVQYAIRMESPVITSTSTDRHVYEILAAVREALLAPEAVEAATNASYGDAVWNYEETEIVEGDLGTVPEILTAALDAAFGEGASRG